MSLLAYVYWLQLHIEFVLGKHLVGNISVETRLGSPGSGVNYRQEMRGGEKKEKKEKRNKRQGRKSGEDDDKGRRKLKPTEGSTPGDAPSRERFFLSTFFFFLFSLFLSFLFFLRRGSKDKSEREPLDDVRPRNATRIEIYNQSYNHCGHAGHRRDAQICM